MKQKSGAMRAHLDQDVTTLCTCWRLTRKDGEIFRFTDHDKDVLLQEAQGGVASLDQWDPGVTVSELGTKYYIPNDSGLSIDQGYWAWGNAGGVNSGKAFYEVKKNLSPENTDSYDAFGIGVVNQSFTNGPGLPGSGNDILYYAGSIITSETGLIGATIQDLPAPSYIGVALDYDAATITFYINGVLSNTVSITPGNTYRPALVGIPVDLLEGGTNPGAVRAECNFGLEPFQFPVPGYENWAGSVIAVDPEVFTAGTGYNRSAIQNSSDLSADNLTVEAILESGSILPSEIRSGLFDQARVDIMVVNWADPTMGYLKMRRGTIGELITTPDGTFKGELRGLAQQLDQNIGEIYQPECRADLGDSRCKVNLVPFTTAATITAVTNRKIFTVSYTDPQVVAGWFNGGRATFTSSDNNGKSIEIKAFSISEGTIELYMSSPFMPEVGDTVNLIPGCDKRRQTCKEIFDNYLNFRGEPFIPGTDELLSYPNAAG